VKVATQNSLVAKISDWMVMSVGLESRNKKYKQCRSKPAGTIEFMAPDVLLYDVLYHDLNLSPI